MYSSGYSQVSKYSMQGGKKMPYRSKGKSCGYYMRIVFFFSSLIQSLIIVSLVLFLIYGKKQDSASTSRVHDLEESFSRLSLESVSLKLQRKNLTTLLNSTLIKKARNDYDLVTCLTMSNKSLAIMQDMRKQNLQCNNDLVVCSFTRQIGGCPRQPGPGNCLSSEPLRAKLELVESNFTQTVKRMRLDMDQIVKQRDNLNLEVIQLRRDKATHEKTVELFKQKCKDDFADSLIGISNVTKAFLFKIDSLFPTHIAFQLTCPKQREHLEQIRTNCTSLSREVEDRFQRYLDTVGKQVSNINAENSRLNAENRRLSDDYRWCSLNRTGMIKQHKQNVDANQLKHDVEKETLLVDKLKLQGEIDLLNIKVSYKTKDAESLSIQLKQLNMSCVHRVRFDSGSSFSSTGVGQYPRTGLGLSSSGSTYNRPVATGAGSSSSSSSSYGSSSSIGSTQNKVATGAGSSSSSGSSYGSSSSTGSTYNRPVATGAGSSSSSGSSYGSSSSTGSTYNRPVATGAGSSSSSGSSFGSSSSAGSTYNKPVSSGGYGSVGSNPSLSSSGTSLNKPAQTGRGSTATGSTGSIPNYSSGGTGLNKPTTNVKTPSSTGSTGSPSKSGGFLGWFGNSNSGQSKTGTGTGRGASSGSSFGGTGLLAAIEGPSDQVIHAQHMQELERFINHYNSEEKKDILRLLG